MGCRPGESLHGFLDCRFEDTSFGLLTGSAFMAVNETDMKSESCRLLHEVLIAPLLFVKYFQNKGKPWGKETYPTFILTHGILFGTFKQDPGNNNLSHIKIVC
jgi:hypothetical protein